MFVYNITYTATVCLLTAMFVHNIMYRYVYNITYCNVCLQYKVMQMFVNNLTHYNVC